MTSNVGARFITDKKTLGFTSMQEENKENSKEYENIKKDVMQELKRQFRPEFINRIDEIIVFRKLLKEEMKQIVDIMLKQVEKRLEAQNIKIEIEEKVKELILEKGIDSNYGARPLKRTVQNMIEDKIAETILDGKIKPNKKAKIKLDEKNNIIID